MSRMPHISVIGSINVDEKITLPIFPKAGETLTAISYSIGAGGKGANQAVACARAGFKSPGRPGVKVDLIGAVGLDDGQYEAIIEPVLKESGVSSGQVIRSPGVPTGKSIVSVDKSGENRIIFCPGANYEAMGNVNTIICSLQRLETARPHVVVMQGEIPAETTVALLQALRLTPGEFYVVFNPAPMYTAGLSAKALTDLAILIVNESECIAICKLLAIESLEAQDQQSGTLGRSQLDAAADYFIHKSGVKVFVVTLGSQGAYCARSKGARGVVPCPEVANVIDSTAAGDTFVGYFAANVAEYLVSGLAFRDMDVFRMVALANIAASKCVGRIGAMDSIPYGFE